MAYKQFPTDKYITEIKRKANIQRFESPIIHKFNTELRAKVKPTITELPPTASENDIRSALTNELSKVLKASDVPNVIENLSKANDLRSFYRFSKTFLNQIKDIRNLDASFFLDLWSKFKSQMLSSVGFSKLEIQSEREGVVPFQGQTAAEYEKSLKPVINLKVPKVSPEFVNYTPNLPVLVPSKKPSYTRTYSANPNPNPYLSGSDEFAYRDPENPFGYRRGGMDHFSRTTLSGRIKESKKKIPRKALPIDHPIRSLVPSDQIKLKGGAIVGQTYLSRR